MSTRRKTAITALFVILGFWLLTKTLNAISKSPGGQDYVTHCANCHGKEGEGIGKLVPPLASADWLESNGEELPCIIRYGIHDSIKVNGNIYYEQMLGMENLTDVQVYNITNYVSKRFTKAQKFYSQDDVDLLLEHCAN